MVTGNWNETQAPDTKPGFYYVTVVKGDGDYRRLRGPFVNDHAAALAAVGAAKDRACEMDPRGHWYSYGTAWFEVDHGPGLLDAIELRTRKAKAAA